jgi:hypothetical protein
MEVSKHRKVMEMMEDALVQAQKSKKGSKILLNVNDEPSTCEEKQDLKNFYEKTKR